jgi:outer membrane lipoprotein LolB
MRSCLRAGRFGILLILSLVAAGCSTTVKEEPAKTVPTVQQDKPASKDRVPVDWADQEQMRNAIQQWELRGRLGVQTETNGGMMDIIWKQTANEFSIRLIAPLGAGSTLIQGANDYATIRYPDGSKQDIDDVNQVFKQALNVDLPASALKNWVRGLPASGMAIQKRTWNELGLIERLQQSGWKVEMKEYTGTDIQMPHAIYLSHKDKDEIDIRLLLKQWLIDD